MSPQFVATVARNIFPAAVCLSGKVPVRLSVGISGGGTHPATGCGLVVGAGVVWAMVGPGAGEAVATSGAAEEELVAALSPITTNNTNGSRIDAASVTMVEMAA